MHRTLFVRRFQDRTPVDAWRDASVHMLSHEGPEWRGFHCSIVRNEGWNIDDVMYDGHYVGLNLLPEPLIFEARCGGEWATVHLPSQAYWVIPEGQPFSVRRGPRCCALNAIVDGAFLDSIVGGHRELTVAVGNGGDVVSCVFRGLMDHVVNGNADAQVTTALIHGFIFALAGRYGRTAAQSWKGVLTQSQVTAIVSWIERHLGNSLTVDQIAAQLGMNGAQFSRAFKRATGKTPWDFVIGARLERAVGLLKQGKSASDVAEECGFSDQAHLSRLFKRSYGTTPAAFSARYRDRGGKLDALGAVSLAPGLGVT